jgi:D-alanyl-D-alanine carboxypeptidase
MRRGGRMAVTIAIMTVVLSAGFGAAAAQPSQLTDRLDRMFQAAYPADEPGAAVAVVHDGQILLREGYGTADMELGVAIEPDMVFRVGSITKQFTASAIMLLVKDGKVAVQDEITRYLPDYPTHGRKITLHHLLTHTSGIPSYTDDQEVMSDLALDRTVEEVIAMFKDKDLLFEPGERWRYSNSNYFLLGAVIEAGTPCMEVTKGSSRVARGAIGMTRMDTPTRPASA